MRRLTLRTSAGTTTRDLEPGEAQVLAAHLSRIHGRSAVTLGDLPEAQSIRAANKRKGRAARTEEAQAGVA